MISKSSAGLDEILEILDLFRYDMSDSEYDHARKVILSKGNGLSAEFDLAVRADQQKVIEFFREL